MKEIITKRHFYIGENANVHIVCALEKHGDEMYIVFYYSGKYGDEEICRKEYDGMSSRSFSKESEVLLEKVKQRALRLFKCDEKNKE